MDVAQIFSQQSVFVVFQDNIAGNFDIACVGIQSALIGYQNNLTLVFEKKGNLYIL